MLANQEWYDDNRQRFEAETTKSPIEAQRCSHTKLFRKSATEVQCACGAGWVDNGRWNIVEGTVRS